MKSPARERGSIEAEPDDGDEHQQAARHRVQEELHRRVDTVGSPQIPMMKYIGISMNSQKT